MDEILFLDYRLFAIKLSHDTEFAWPLLNLRCTRDPFIDLSVLVIAAFEYFERITKSDLPAPANGNHGFSLQEHAKA
jgi:hypothetical protein